MPSFIGQDYCTWVVYGNDVEKADIPSALAKVFNSNDYKDFMNARGFGLLYADAAGFGRHMEEADKALGDAMKAAGLAKA